jgi:YtkA-like
MSRLGRIAVVLVLLASLPVAVLAQDKTIATQKSGDVVVTLKNPAGQWTQGKNEFVLELTSAKDKSPVDAAKAAVSTSMPMPGMAPMIAGATLTPEGPGRYKGTISFPDSGTRQVTVTWDGPTGKGSAQFSVPVR